MFGQKIVRFVQVISTASCVRQPTLAPLCPISLLDSPFLSTVTSPFHHLTVLHGSHSLSMCLSAPEEGNQSILSFFFVMSISQKHDIWCC